MNTPSRNHIFFNDVTLRDGEQAPGNTMDRDEKIIIAKQLVKLGINGIEAGFPAASTEDYRSVSDIGIDVGTLLPSSRIRPRISGLARLHRQDISSVLRAMRLTQHRGVHTFISTSDAQLPKFEEAISKCGGDPKSMNDFLKKIVIPNIESEFQYIREEDPTVVIQFSPEDWTRTDEHVSDEVVIAAAANGARIINLPDTIGIGIPRVIGKRVAHVRELLDRNGFQNVIISWHGHNDTGMGAANALEALYGGARQFETTILGIGERTGNFAFESFLAALDANRSTHEEIIGYPIHDTIVRSEVMNTARLVARTIEIDIPREHPIVGANAFAEESGIHVDGINKGGTDTYHALKAETYGAKRKVVIGKHAGWSNMVDFCTRHQLPFRDGDRDRFMKNLKHAAENRRKGLSDEEILEQIYYPTVEGIIFHPTGIEIPNMNYIQCFEELAEERERKRVKLSMHDGNQIIAIASHKSEGVIDAIVRGMQQIIPDVNIGHGGLIVTTTGEGSDVAARVKVTMHNTFSVSRTAENKNTTAAEHEALIRTFNTLYAIEQYAALIKETNAE